MATLIEQWDRDPIVGFDEFVQSVDFVKTSSRIVDERRLKPLSKASADICRFMFGKYARWLTSRGTSFSQATHYDLLMFIELGSVVGGKRIPDLNSKISYRYLRLVERCYLHLQIYPNPAQHVIFGALKQQRHYSDKQMVTLGQEQLDRFVAALPSSTLPSEWRQRRDRALQLVMLFAGLRVSEVIGLLLSEVSRQAEIDGTLEIKLTPEQKRATSYEHSTFLNKEAVPVVLEWVAEREALPIAGELVFPSDNGARQHQTTVYRQVKATLRAAGIEIPRSGGRTLRNTFAIQEIRNGTKTPVLTKKLGLALERSTETYIQAEKARENPTD
jgi:integrase